MGHINREMLTVDKTMDHQDVSGPEIVLALLIHDEVNRAALECERDRLAVQECKHLRLIK